MDRRREQINFRSVAQSCICICTWPWLFVLYLREPSKVFSAQSLGRVKGLLPEAFWCDFQYLLFCGFILLRATGARKLAF